MIDETFVLLADESVHWKIAGLTQLERLRLSLGESAFVVCERPDTPPAGARILSTRLFLHRNALADFLNAAPRVEGGKSWAETADDFERPCPRGPTWRYLHSPNDIAAAENDFLRRMGKPQDGFVSRFINRPLTRPITRQVLRTPITPTGWTLGIFLLPWITAAFLAHGSYLSIIIGTAIYQLYSMLDGCDGEIARAKFLESKSGGRIDDFCDIAGALLFVSALGFGLGGPYRTEGIALALLIAVNEWLLHLPQAEAPTAGAGAAYPRHRRLLQGLGNSPVVAIALQATKRDVGILLFLILALIGQPQWILHPWLAVTLTTLVLNAVSALRGLTTR